jgi:hypothetical protein
LLRSSIIFTFHLIGDGIEKSLFAVDRRGGSSAFITLEFL